MKKFVILAVLSAVLFSVAGSVNSHVLGKGQKVFLSQNAIPNSYIVVFDETTIGQDLAAPGVEADAQYLAAVYGGSVKIVYSNALKGFGIQMSDEQAVAMSKDENVLYIEQDAAISVASSQLNPTWTLDRVDQRNMPLSGSYDYNSTGAGVHAYIIDTGIRATHVEFGGRASSVYDNVGDGQNGFDCNGHGTHVAGIIGGTTYGVAKNVFLHGVRVLPCNGSGQISNLIAGIDWVTANRVNPAVVNISITAAGSSPSLETSVTNSIASGVTFTIAAGNSATDACNFTPARVPSALTVGGSDEFDSRARYSNLGTCVDLFAPGNMVLSTWSSSDTATNTLSGTSMAAPMVAGVAALYLSANPTANPAAVSIAIMSSATSGVLATNDTSSPNKLLYSWVTGGPAPTPTPTPTATPTPAPSPTPATIRIRKRIQGAATQGLPVTEFPYAAVNIATTSFSLQNNQDFIDPSVQPNTSANPIVVTETPVGGWQLISIVCTETSGGPPNIQNTVVDLANHKATIIAEQAEQVDCTFTSQPITPTSGAATISGRITDSGGSGLRNVTLGLIDPSNGEVLYARTNAFGMYSIENMPVGRTYVLTAYSTKRWTITNSTRTITLNDDLANIDFVGELSGL